MPKHTHDLEDFSMVTRNKHDDVDVRYENGVLVPAVCVKVRGRLFDRLPSDLHEANEKHGAVAEQYVRDLWWSATPQALADEHLKASFPNARTYAAGRSDGWVIVAGAGIPGEWTAKQHRAWKCFEQAIEASIVDAEALFVAELRKRAAK